MKPIMTRTIRAITRLTIVGESVDRESLTSRAFPREMMVLIESIADLIYLMTLVRGFVIKSYRFAVALIDRRLNITFLLVHMVSYCWGLKALLDRGE